MIHIHVFGAELTVREAALSQMALVSLLGILLILVRRLTFWLLALPV